MLPTGIRLNGGALSGVFRTRTERPGIPPALVPNFPSWRDLIAPSVVVPGLADRNAAVTIVKLRCRCRDGSLARLSPGSVTLRSSNGRSKSGTCHGGCPLARPRVTPQLHSAHPTDVAAGRSSPRRPELPSPHESFVMGRPVWQHPCSGAVGCLTYEAPAASENGVCVTLGNLRLGVSCRSREADQPFPCLDSHISRCEPR